MSRKGREFDHSHYQIWMNPEDLTPYPKNAKQHDKVQVKNIANSIRRFGWQQEAVVTQDNVLVIGHGRRLAALMLKCQMPVKVIDQKAEELTDEDIRELRIADNKTNESPWDYELLADDLDGLDFEGFDFDFDLPEEEEPIEITEDDYDKPLPDEPKSKLGDIYQLGRHRLICGDSTDPAVIDRLMDGAKADMVFTDPPYGVDYDGGVIHGSKINKEHKRQRLKNDDNDIYSEFIPILNRIIDNGAIYIFYATRNSYEILKPLKENDIEVHSIIAWNKINTGYADMNSHYKNKYEPCVYACRKGYSLNWNGGTTENTVWDIEKDRDNKLHPTQKPIELPTRAIRNSSRKGDIVVDLFGGSGSTLIACEQLKRKCYMCELDQRYVDVIIDRWETFTGEKAVLING